MRGAVVAAIAVLGTPICLPAPPKAELLVSIGKSQQRVSVTIDGANELAAKSQRAASEDPFDDKDNGTQRAAKFAKAVAYRVSVSNDEAQILREREAWLRSLDRKYGITH
jgi:hypothetical protein